MPWWLHEEQMLYLKLIHGLDAAVGSEVKCHHRIPLQNSNANAWINKHFLPFGVGTNRYKILKN